ncbi:MAG TPA: c-type cytochrome [Candidatus Acidoferrales bacterium]|jgi:mono/diheme cytochrome c family protein|nr:c-type cytochrome [Candidatus Acidoferrales bacterium]
MMNPRIRTAAMVAALLVSGATAAMAQDTVKKSTIPMTSASSGQEMFNTYCAVCHGTGGKGDGPASSEFKIAPANLTMLAKNHNGTFPEAYVSQVIQTGPRDAKAHGSKDMPVWGRLFASLGDDATVKLRVHNLTTYIGSLQAK